MDAAIFLEVQEVSSYDLLKVHMKTIKMTEKVMGQIAFFLILGMNFLGEVACTSSNGSLSESRPILTLGLSADYPPFEFNQDGKIVGFDVDLAQEVARRLGYDLSIQDMDFSVLIPSIQNGRIDFAMSGMTITEIRKKNVDFSDVYFKSGFALILKKESQFSKEEDFKGKKIGVQLGTTMEKFAQLKAQIYPDLKVVALGKNSILIQELKSERLFGVLVEESQATEFVKANSSLKSFVLGSRGDGYAIVFPKDPVVGRVEFLKEKFNAELKNLRKNGKMRELRLKWLGKK